MSAIGTNFAGQMRYWAFRRWLRGVLDIPGDMLWFVRRLILWAPIIWNDADFDHDYLTRIMAFKLRLMAKSAKHWCVRDADRSRREMLIAATLIERIAADEYPGIMRDGITRPAVLLKMKQQRADLHELARLFERKLLRWWD